MSRGTWSLDGPPRMGRGRPSTRRAEEMVAELRQGVDRSPAGSPGRVAGEVKVLLCGICQDSLIN